MVGMGVPEAVRALVGSDDSVGAQPEIREGIGCCDRMVPV